MGIKTLISADFTEQEIDSVNKNNGIPLVENSINDKMGTCILKAEYELKVENQELREKLEQLYPDGLKINGQTKIKVYGPNIRAKSKDNKVYKPLCAGQESKNFKFLTKGVEKQYEEEVGVNGE